MDKRMQKAWTQTEINRVQSLRMNGFSVIQISNMIGRSRDAVNSMLTRLSAGKKEK